MLSGPAHNQDVPDLTAARELYFPMFYVCFSTVTMKKNAKKTKQIKTKVSKGLQRDPAASTLSSSRPQIIF